jgi:hypothetical protein
MRWIGRAQISQERESKREYGNNQLETPARAIDQSAAISSRGAAARK